MTPEIMDVDQHPTVLAILTMDDVDKGFRGNRRNFSDIIEEGQKAGVLVYVTTVNHEVFSRYS